MIVLHLEQELSASPYFDIHHAQRCDAKASGWVFSGTLGDGWYEGEVSVTVGPQSSVAFADEWFDPAALREFFARIDREQLCNALYNAVDDLVAVRCQATANSRLVNPHWHIEPVHGIVSSGEARWSTPI